MYNVLKVISPIFIHVSLPIQVTIQLCITWGQGTRCGTQQQLANLPPTYQSSHRLFEGGRVVVRSELHGVGNMDILHWHLRLNISEILSVWGSVFMYVLA